MAHSVGEVCTFRYKGRRERIIFGRGTYADPAKYDKKKVKIEEAVSFDSAVRQNKYLVTALDEISGRFLVFEDELE